MDSLDKLEMVLQGMIRRRQNEIERARGAGAHPAYPYINGLEHEKIGLEIALWQLRAIKQNAPGVSNKNVIKMYGTQK